MEANIKVIGDTTTGVNFAINIAGVVFDATADQSVEGQVDSAAARAAGQYAFAVGNAGTIYVQFQASTTGENNVAVLYSLNSTILNAEPTWASLGTTAAAALEGVIAADVYIAPATATSAGLLSRESTGTHVSNWQGAFAEDNLVHKYTVLGNMVYFTLPAHYESATSADILQLTTALPIAIRPTETVSGVYRAIENNAGSIGHFRVSASGVVTFYPTVTGANFTNGQNCGLEHAQVLTWSLA
jgi:hypothetical protein